MLRHRTGCAGYGSGSETSLVDMMLFVFPMAGFELRGLEGSAEVTESDMESANGNKTLEIILKNYLCG